MLLNCLIGGGKRVRVGTLFQLVAGQSSALQINTNLLKCFPRYSLH